MFFGIVALQLKTYFRKIFFQHDWLRGRETVVVQNQIQSSAVEQRVETPAQAVFRNDFDSVPGFAPVATETKSAEDWVVRQNRRGGAQCTTVAEINFRREIPRAAMVGLSEPGLPVWRRLESAARAAVVGRAGIPVAVVGLGRARVHQGPRAEIRRVAEAEIRTGVGGEIERVIEDTPATHLRHVGQHVSVATAAAIIAAEIDRKSTRL